MARHICLVTVLLFTGSICADEPKAPAPADSAKDKRLDEILKAWSERVLNTQSLSTKCRRIRKEPLTKKETAYEGELYFKRPHFARIELYTADKKEEFQKLLLSGKQLHFYVPKEKTVMVLDVSSIIKWFDPSNLPEFLIWMNPLEMKKRYNIQLQKETDFYAYILLEPRKGEDESFFKQAQIVLYLKNPPDQKANLDLTPVRLWYRESNQRETTYLFSETIPDAKLDKSMFEPGKLPEGWQVKEIDQLLPGLKLSLPR